MPEQRCMYLMSSKFAIRAQVRNLNMCVVAIFLLLSTCYTVQSYALMCKVLLAEKDGAFDERLGLALRYSRKGQNTLALEIAHEVLSLEPQNVDALTVLSRVHLNREDFTKARDLQLRVIRLQSNFDLGSFELLLKVYEKLDDLRSQAMILDAILSEVPDHIHAVKKRASLFLLTGDVENAGKWIQKAFKAVPDDHQTLVLIIEYLMKTKDFKNAMTFSNRLVELVQGYDSNPMTKRLFHLAHLIRAKVRLSNIEKLNDFRAFGKDYDIAIGGFFKKHPWIQRVKLEMFYRKLMELKKQGSTQAPDGALSVLSKLMDAKEGAEVDLYLASAAIGVTREASRSEYDFWKSTLTDEEWVKVKRILQGEDWDLISTHNDLFDSSENPNDFWGRVRNINFNFKN